MAASNSPSPNEHAQVVGVLGRLFSNGALELELKRLHAHWDQISQPSPRKGKRS